MRFLHKILCGDVGQPVRHTVTSPQQQSGGWLLECWLLATVAVQCCHTLHWQTFIDRPDNPDMWSLFDDVWNGELESEILGESINQYLQTSISSNSMCLLQELCTLHILNIVKHCVHVCYILYVCIHVFIRYLIRQRPAFEHGQGVEDKMISKGVKIQKMSVGKLAI